MTTQSIITKHVGSVHEIEEGGEYMSTPTQEQVVLLEKLRESFLKDRSFMECVKGAFGLDQEEPTMDGLLKYAERFIRTQHGLTGGSWTGESRLLEMTLSCKVKQEKTTT